MLWCLSLSPLVGFLLQDLLDHVVPECYTNKGFCYRTFYISLYSKFTIINSILCTAVIGSVFLVMVAVYAYIIWLVRNVMTNPSFARTRAAVITTLFLTVSFFISYIVYFTVHVKVLVQNNPSPDVKRNITKEFTKMCSSCDLIMEFLFTGTIGAIIDPIIYCVRIKEAKSGLQMLFHLGAKRRRSSVISSLFVSSGKACSNRVWITGCTYKSYHYLTTSTIFITFSLWLICDIFFYFVSVNPILYIWVVITLRFIVYYFVRFQLWSHHLKLWK